MFRRCLAVCAALVTLSLTLPGSAAAEAAYADRSGKFQMGAGVGMGIDPVGVAGGLEMQFFPADVVSIGPRFSFLPSEKSVLEENIYLLMLDLRFHPPMGSSAKRIRPFIGVGGGMAIVDFDILGAGHTSQSVAIEFGAGVNMFLADNFSVGTQAHLVLPLNADAGWVDENAFVEWQIVHFDFVF